MICSLLTLGVATLKLGSNILLWRNSDAGKISNNPKEEAARAIAQTITTVGAGILLSPISYFAKNIPMATGISAAIGGTAAVASKIVLEKGILSSEPSLFLSFIMGFNTIGTASAMLGLSGLGAWSSVRDSATRTRDLLYISAATITVVALGVMMNGGYAR